MKKLKLTFLAVILASGLIQAQLFSNRNQKATAPMDVQFNKNVEFLGFTFFLGSMGSHIDPDKELFNGSVKMKDWYAHDLELYQQYKSFLENKNLQTASRFIEKTDGSDLSLLFLQLDDFPNAIIHEGIKDQFFIPWSEKGDPEEGKRNAAAFIQALNEFYEDVRFDHYFSSNKIKYTNALRQINDNLPDSAFIPAMEAFYKSGFNQYVLVPSLTIPTGMGFGAKLEKDGKVSIYNVFGPLGVQKIENEASLDMGFGDAGKLRELSTHEFGHSFVKPAIDNLPKDLIEASSHLFTPVKSAMEDQSYINWEICLNEHFVRAGEVLIARNTGNEREAEKLKKDYIENRKFIYLPLILEDLEHYNKTGEISYQEAVRQILKKLSAIKKP